MAIKDQDKKKSESQSSEANNTNKNYVSPVMAVYGQSGGDQHKLKFYHVPTRKEIVFPAFLTNFNDSYTSNWTQENVYGRMDAIPLFENTTRTMNLGFQVVPDSGATAKTYMQRVQNLIQRLYPTYTSSSPTRKKRNDFNIVSTAPVWKIKFANLISSKTGANSSARQSGQLCYITSLDFAPDLDQGFIMSDNNIYPKKIEISLSITVLHDHTVGFIGNRFQGKGNYPYRVSGDSSVPPAFRDQPPQKFNPGQEGPQGNAARQAAVNKTLNPPGEKNE